MNVITVPKGFTEVKNPDPYIKYLTRRSMDIHTPSDQESLFKHFQNLISSGSGDKELLKDIVSLLSEFMDKRDVEEASGSINQE
jgi:hypothetical protein